MEMSHDAEGSGKRHIHSPDQASPDRRPGADDSSDWLKSFIDRDIPLDEGAAPPRFRPPQLPARNAAYLYQPTATRSRAIWFAAGFGAAFAIVGVLAFVLTGQEPNTGDGFGKLKPLVETTPTDDDNALATAPAIAPDPLANADISPQSPLVGAAPAGNDNALADAPAVASDPSANADISPQPSLVGTAPAGDANALADAPAVAPDPTAVTTLAPPVPPLAAAPLRDWDSAAPTITVTPLPPLLKQTAALNLASVPGAPDDISSVPPAPVPPRLALTMPAPPKSAIAPLTWPADTLIHIRILFDEDGLDAVTANTLANTIGRGLGAALPVEMIPKPSTTDGVRYFFPEDRMAATRVADNIGQLTGLEEPISLARAEPPPAPGTVEIHLPVRTERILKNEGL